MTQDLGAWHSYHIRPQGPGQKETTMYAVFHKMETKGEFKGRARKFDTSSVASAWDRYHLARIKGQDGAPQGGVGVVLVNTDTGKILRTHLFPVVQLPALKLSDAMAKALDTDHGSGGLVGAGNTMKALASRGLASNANGTWELTNLGRQYRAQRKGA